jgi:hypothetical protein
MEPFGEDDTEDIVDILSPLRLLRRVGSLIIRAALPEDVKYLKFYQKRGDYRAREFKTDEDDFRVEFWDLPESDMED